MRQLPVVVSIPKAANLAEPQRRSNNLKEYINIELATSSPGCCTARKGAKALKGNEPGLLPRRATCTQHGCFKSAVGDISHSKHRH